MNSLEEFDWAEWRVSIMVRYFSCRCWRRRTCNHYCEDEKTWHEAACANHQAHSIRGLGPEKRLIGTTKAMMKMVVSIRDELDELLRSHHTRRGKPILVSILYVYVLTTLLSGIHLGQT